jgi:hypothetical protein
MLTRNYRVRVYRWVATLSLTAYGVFGVFGHSLHGLLPCDDGSCGSSDVAEHHCCCGHHEAAPQVVATPALDGAAFRSAGHDADDCSLCTLLAKIKVGQAAMFHADFCVEYSHHEQIAVSQRLPADLNLSGTPRAPPAC